MARTERVQQLKKTLPAWMQGFTLIELVVVIALLTAMIAVFATLAPGIMLQGKGVAATRAYALLDEARGALQSIPFANLTNRSSASFLGLLYNQGDWIVETMEGAPSATSVLSLRAPASPKYRNFTGLVQLPTAPRGNFTLKTKIKLPTSSPYGWSAGLMFRARDVENHYRLVIRADRAELLREENGTTTTLASDPIAIDLNAWYTLEMRAEGSKLSVYINDVLIREITDTIFNFGIIALLSFDQATPYFDDITLIETSTKTWNFDTDTPSLLPAPWQRFSPYDLPKGETLLTIENYLGQNSIKRVTMRIDWREGMGTTTASLQTLIKQ